MPIEKTSTRVPEPFGLSRWKAIAQRRIERLTTLLTTEPRTTLHDTRRTLFLKRLQQRLDVREQWTNEVASNLATVRDLLEEHTGPAVAAQVVHPTTKRSTPNVRKTGDVG